LSTTKNKTGWASLDNEVKRQPKSKRPAKVWDVDADHADRIYGSMTRWDRPTSWFDLNGEDEDWDTLMADAGDDYWQKQRVENKKREAKEREERAQMTRRLKRSVQMVQTFVDALSGDQSNYTVGLDATISTAMTNLQNRTMRLPSKVILDPALTEEEAALLMVAYLGHEIGHVRFDDHLDKALQADNRVVDVRGIYTQLSNILREARVESGFSSLFPGYSGLFEPLLRWISRETNDGSVPPEDALGFAVAATRYPFRFDWSNPGHAQERDWWVQWVRTYENAEDYATHKTGLDEAYAHIKANLPQPKPQDGSQAGQSGASGAGQPSPYTTAAAQRDDHGYEAQQEKNRIQREANDKLAELREEAAKTGDWQPYYDQREQIEKKARADKAAVTRNKNKADQSAASIPASIEQYDPNKGKPKQSARKQARERAQVQEATNDANGELGLSHSGTPFKPATLGAAQPRKGGPTLTDWDATGIFRSMFMRMRGGNDGRIGSKRSGRLDDRRIFRLADKKDDRVFTRRGAPKTQHLRVYLMVDTSGSMSGRPIHQVRGVAKSLIEASFGADKLTLEVYGWNAGVNPVWSAGMDPDEVERLNAGGGTDDASALLFAVERMQQELRQDEHGLILMMSDGQGQGNQALKVHVDKARTLGMSVFGITMAEDNDQTGAYGENGWVKWQGSVAATAQPLAEIISQSWLTKDQHRA
jgi:hypothetical protein